MIVADAAIPESYAYHQTSAHKHPHGRIQLGAHTHHDTDILLGTNLTEVSSATHVPLTKRSLDNGVQLRILPLGASIVYGLKSSDGNGFRYGLRNQLIYDGNPINIIGSVTTGTMADDDCEGWPGYVITQVAAKAELSIPFQPNLVLLHVGTNDAVESVDIENAGSRLGTLIDRLFDAIPGVTIVASTLLPNGNPTTQANIAIYNSQIPGVVQARQAAGQHITYVDFSSPYFGLSDIGSDGYHSMAHPLILMFGG